MARPDYQRRLVPLLGGGVAALALGYMIAPQIDLALHPNFDAASLVQGRLVQAVRLDGELRAAMAALTMQFADKRQQCGQEATPATGAEMRLPPDVLHARRFSLLAGCWTSTAGIKNARSGDDLSIELCFNTREAAALSLIEAGGNRCTAGLLRTNLRPPEMTIEAETLLQCGDGKTYNAPRITCRPGPDLVANCQAQTGSIAFVPTRFTRK
jgi:hypothetical protein